jgi:hypothetical protein
MVQVTAADIDRLRGSQAGQHLLSSMLAPRKMDLYSPFLIGAWLDSLFLGLIAIMWVRWLVYVRPTDTKWTRILMYYIMLPNLFSSVGLIIHVLHLMSTNFGNYIAFFDLTSAYHISLGSWETSLTYI